MRRFLRRLKFWDNLGMSAPIYTTRPAGRHAETATYSQSLWITLLAQVVVFANVILWGGIGIVEAVSRII